MKENLTQLGLKLRITNKKAELTTLLPHISKSMINAIFKQCKEGDPDWVLDMISELDYIDENSPSYMPEFHGVMLAHNLKSKDFDNERLIRLVLEIEAMF